MRYTLKDYQDDAVHEVLNRLARAREDWERWRTPVAFSLTATTGAGKTVMAAAAIECLVEGNTEYDFEADPNGIVLWVTDDPSLNEQTRFRLLAASDRLGSRLTVIENTFDQEKLEAGRVYFLNLQKLGRNSLLVRGPGDPGEEIQGHFANMPNPDQRRFTMWETLGNTISDEHLVLYLILDEAHRGMRPTTRNAAAEKATIVQRLINGASGIPPAPIVWGISATVERFNAAMAKATNRTTYAGVVVDSARVQASGLLKDDIRLDFPVESGRFDTVLLSRAARKVKEATDLWQAYAHSEGATAKVVLPLLVVQVPNTPSDELLLSAFRAVRDAWPEMEEDGMAHVFGDHAPLEIGEFTVPYVSPETVEDRSHIRVLFAKDAVSTGWDCPRAEVLMSFRPAQDETHITQLLGRMVRTPLARRVPGHDLLNSVHCVLPLFNRETAARVAKAMLGHREEDSDGTGGGDGRRVLFAPIDLEVNPGVPAWVWAAFDALPSQTLPRRAARPARRLAALAHALAYDGLRRDARKGAYEELFAVLNGLMARHSSQVAKAVAGILEVQGETAIVSVGDREIVPGGTFTESADERSIDAELRAAGRVLTLDLARKYAESLAQSGGDDDSLFDAYVQVAALAKVDGVGDELDRAANDLAERWFGEYRVAIKGLADERRGLYDEIKGMSSVPQAITLTRPRVRTEETQLADGTELETRPHHLMSDPAGDFPVASLNAWEIEVIDTEMKRKDFVAWYRNPSRPSADAVAVAYRNTQGDWRRMCPDFVFFHGDPTNVKVSIVDPHGLHLADALTKLRGLAAFAESHGRHFHRIEAVAKLADGRLRVLDLMSEAVRQAVSAATDATELYEGTSGIDY